MHSLLLQTTVSPKLLQRLERRDIALWIGEVKGEDADAVVRLAALPWATVLIESTDTKLAMLISEAANRDDNLVKTRGFAHVVAVDPAGLQLPHRSLPIYFLNGLRNRQGAEAAELGRFANIRRRLNCLARLQALSPTEIVIVGSGSNEPIASVQELWAEGFRFLVSVASEADTDRSSIEEWLAKKSSPAAVDYYALPLTWFAQHIDASYRASSQPSRLLIHIRRSKVAFREIDITSCELAEQPILDRYEMITRYATRPLQPEELSFDDLTGFFDRSTQSWRPFAAGLPWRRDPTAIEKVRRTLERAEREGAQANRLLIIESESGAGGSTLARSVAFEMATAGFPTLVARQTNFTPSAIELSSFLLRFHRLMEAQADAPSAEIPWLLVFDVEHWSGREGELRAFMNQLTKDGRVAIILVVVDDDAVRHFDGMGQLEPIAVLRHEIERDDAVALGVHLNRFLKVHGKVRQSSEWLQFWEHHRPSIETPVASFWIALEFWLKEQLNIGESIQQWMYRQFSDLEVALELKDILLQIAALSIEREPLPDGLISRIPDAALPTSILLEQCRNKAPALGLLSEQGTIGKRWALAHTQQGRHLLNAAFFDRNMCERLQLGEAQNPTHLRLLLLRRITSRPELATYPYRDLGIDFAVRILKLDPGHATEFFPLWRHVLPVLEAVPDALRRTSRSFLHHVAISRRRIATSTNFFDASDAEREDLLRAAVAEIEAALGLPRGPGDESDLNLWNSLALAYQNLAETRRQLSADEKEIATLRESATAATLRAQQEDPLNPYVLETAAKNLVQSALMSPEHRIKDATQALGFIHEAMVRERSSARQPQLSRIFRDAIRILAQEDTAQIVDKLKSSGNAFGYVAAAWLFIAQKVGKDEQDSLAERIDTSVANEALSILDGATTERGLLWLKLYYDLLAIAQPLDFRRQLELLEELEGTWPQVPLQYQLEHAVLLYQAGRHLDADRRFSTLRRLLKERDAYVEVPKRLQWLLTSDRGSHQVCEARVYETSGYRHRARVKDIGNTIVPFIPQEFGKRTFNVGEVLSVAISFGAMGPFAKPPSQSD